MTSAQAKESDVGQLSDLIACYPGLRNVFRMYSLDVETRASHYELIKEISIHVAYEGGAVVAPSRVR